MFEGSYFLITLEILAYIFTLKKSKVDSFTFLSVSARVLPKYSGNLVENLDFEEHLVNDIHRVLILALSVSTPNWTKYPDKLLHIHNGIL